MQQPEHDRPITRKERLLVAAVLVLLACVMVTCTACTAKQIQQAMLPTRNPGHQIKSAMGLRVTCPDMSERTGSATIVRSGRVLTAKHVVDCTGHTAIDGDVTPMFIIMDPGNGEKYPLTLDVVYPGMDLAFLASQPNDISKWYDPVTVGPLPALGDKVCEAAAHPRWTYRCGDVEYSTSEAIHVSMFTEFGNSGAAVYDQQGRIIGVTDSTEICQGNFQCVDGIVPVQSLAWYIEE